MSLADRLARWWAHRRLHRGRCESCLRLLPDTGTVVSGYRVCSPECALDAWDANSY